MTLPTAIKVSLGEAWVSLDKADHEGAKAETLMDMQRQHGNASPDGADFVAAALQALIVLALQHGLSTLTHWPK